MAGVHDFVGEYACEQGATFSRQIVVRNPNGTAVNLTGQTGRMQVRRSPGSDVVLASLTSANGKIAITAAAGTITLNLPSSETTLLLPGMYAYDLELVSAGSVQRLLQGAFEVSAEVTR